MKHKITQCCGLLIAAVLLIASTGVLLVHTTPARTSTGASGLRVTGNQLLDANNQPVHRVLIKREQNTSAQEGMSSLRVQLTLHP